jgi:hypothetical protein
MAEKRKPAEEAANAEIEPQTEPVLDLVGPVTAETRRPLGKIKPRLDNSPPPAGFHARWINDAENRLHDARMSGYEFMKDREGRPMKQVVGVKRIGGPLVAYRMMIPIEWYAADRAKFEEARRSVEADMMRGRHGRGADDGRYLPMSAGQPISSITASYGRLK